MKYHHRTGKCFSIDIYGSGPHSEPIKAFAKKNKLPVILKFLNNSLHNISLFSFLVPFFLFFSHSSYVLPLFRYFLCHLCHCLSPYPLPFLSSPTPTISCLHFCLPSLPLSTVTCLPLFPLSHSTFICPSHIPPPLILFTYPSLFSFSLSTFTCPSPYSSLPDPFPH